MLISRLEQVFCFAARRNRIGDSPVARGWDQRVCRAKIDAEEGLIRVRRQIPAGRREVILARGIAKLLQALARLGVKRPGNFVFTNTLGPGSTTATLAKPSATRSNTPVQRRRRLSLHSLRHAFASLLISKGLNVVFVSRQLGHANPNITLEVYAHVFGRADHGAAARDAIEAGYAAMDGSRCAAG